MIQATPTGWALRYGALELPFTIESSARKTVAITVHPDRTLQVVAPRDADVETVLKRVDAKARWIAHQWRAFAAGNPSDATEDRRGYFAGETHWYLGRAYRLKMLPQGGIIETENYGADLPLDLSLFDDAAPDDLPLDGDAPDSTSRAAGVTLEGRFLWVRARARDDEPEAARAARTKRLLTAWYRERAHETFALWIDKCLAKSRSLELGSAPTWEVRRMHKRWGSCTPGGKLMLGLDLVKTPVDCIEYVIFHELCHLQVPHHGPEFYRLLGRFLPDWKMRKATLEEWGEKI